MGREGGMGLTLYVWPRIAQATDNYHTAGGVLVVAATETQARAMAMAQGAMIAPTEHPTLVRSVEGPEGVVIFPDAGCC